MNTIENFQVRQCRPNEVKYLLELTNKDEWDFSMYDIEGYYRLDSDFLLVAVDKNDIPVGFAGIGQQAPGIFYFSNFIVREDLRGNGIGKLLWKASLERAGDRNMVLDGGRIMAEWYKTHGFPYQAYTVLFYTVNVTEEMKKATIGKFDVTDLDDALWPKLLSYDKLVYPNFDREPILRAIFKDTSLVRVVVAKDNGKIVGYGSIHKKPLDQYGLRNVFADNEEVLEAILREMFLKLPVETKVMFMLVDEHPLPQLLKHSVRGWDTAERMYNKKKIKINTERMWLATAHII